MRNKPQFRKDIEFNALYAMYLNEWRRRRQTPGYNLKLENHIINTINNNLNKIR